MIRDFYSFQPKPLKGFAPWDGIFNKIKEYWDNYSLKISFIRYARRADLTPFPIQTADSRGVSYLSSDSIRNIRTKIYESPSFQRKPLSFKLSWKSKIDEITGGDTRVFHGYNLAKSFLISESMIGDVDELDSTLDSEPYSTRLSDPPIGSIRVDLGITPTKESLDSLIELCKPLENIYMFIDFGIIKSFSYGQFIIGEESIADNNFVIGPSNNQSGEYFLPLRSL